MRRRSTIEARRELSKHWVIGTEIRATGEERILGELVDLAGYHRKHATRVLRSERRIKVPAPSMANRCTTRP